MKNVNSTIISQYANSPTLLQLIDSMNQYFSADADIDAFYAAVWNVLDNGATLNSYGLDVWGRIVGLPGGRNLYLPAGISNPGGATFTPGTYVLDNVSFRTLILVKALANITDCTAPSLNHLLTQLFKSRGRCYVKDTGNMTMTFTFEFYLLPFEYAIVTASGAVPYPAGVLVTIEQIASDTFGFDGSGLEPFDQGTFFPG
jgi:hypothetical protein